jgi:hypothetical protein
MWRPACRLVSIRLATAVARGTVLCQEPKPTQQFSKLLGAGGILYSTQGLVANELLGEGHTSKGDKKSLLPNHNIVSRGVIHTIQQPELLLYCNYYRTRHTAAALRACLSQVVHLACTFKHHGLCLLSKARIERPHYEHVPMNSTLAPHWLL